MSFGKALDRSFTAAENEYLSEEIVVTIIPNINHPTFKFISGQFGPLLSGLPCSVPLWLAINLRKRGKCVIKIPDWLTVESLESLVKHERSQVNLGELPYHYMEIAQLLLTHANEDFLQSERISALLQDIENIRMDRVRLGIVSIAETVYNGDSVVSTTINNVSAIELLSMKRYFLSSLDTFLWLKAPESEA